MDKENIKEPAINYEPTRFVAYRALWHDAKEEPKYDEYFLYENVVHAYHVDGIYPSEDELFAWDDYVKDCGLIRWAYIKDLIPTED